MSFLSIQFTNGILKFGSLWFGPPCLKHGIISSYERNRSSFIPVRFSVQKIISPYAIRSLIPALNSWEDWLLAFFAQFWAWPKFSLTDPVSHQSADAQFVLARVIPQWDKSPDFYGHMNCPNLQIWTPMASNMLTLWVWELWATSQRTDFWLISSNFGCDRSSVSQIQSVIRVQMHNSSYHIGTKSLCLLSHGWSWTSLARGKFHW